MIQNSTKDMGKSAKQHYNIFAMLTMDYIQGCSERGPSINLGK